MEQYCEAIPEGGGSQSGNDFQRDAAATGGGGTGGGGRRQQPRFRPADVTEALEAAGADGAAVRELVQSLTRRPEADSDGLRRQAMSRASPRRAMRRPAAP